MSKKPAVLVTRRLPPAVEERLARDYEPHFNTQDRLYGTEELVTLAKAAQAILASHTEHLSADVMARLSGTIKVIANFSVGVDHCDLAAAEKHGIIVTNTPDVLADATAELTMLLILGAARRASEGERLIRSREWDTWSPTFMLGTQVTGKRLGIIGLGRIGQVTAERARGFDMEIHYHNRSRLDAAKEAGAIYHDSLDSLLPLSEFLALHCPNTPDTQNLFNAERIAQLPDGAIVVNSARGNIVDEDALIAALRSGKIGAAGLDVFKNEPHIRPEFAELDNTFLLPHLGSATHETRDAMGFRALDNLDAAFAGQEPRDRVA